VRARESAQVSKRMSGSEQERERARESGERVSVFVCLCVCVLARVQRGGRERAREGERKRKGGKRVASRWAVRHLNVRRFVCVVDTLRVFTYVSTYIFSIATPAMYLMGWLRLVGSLK